MRFFSITKPGIIFGNIITVTGGYFLGVRDNFDLALFVVTVLGIALVIASGCVLNNIIDQDIDTLMERTRKRVLVTGMVSEKIALYYGIFLGILGFLILALRTNWLTVLLAFMGFFFYVVVYSLGFKRKSTHGTTIGGVAGAIPPVVGYCAVTNRFDVGAILLFLILFLWQMPHFYAISIYRMKDFNAAAIPILPLQKNIHYTKIVMLLYVIAFTIVAILPTIFGYTGWIYFSVALCLGLIWLAFSIQGFFTQNDNAWARKMFLFSIIAITVLCMVMAVK